MCSLLEQSYSAIWGKMSGCIVFFWDNLGPVHADRLNAVAKAVAAQVRVIGLEYRAKSLTYPWDAGVGDFDKVTLFEGGTEPLLLARLWRMIAAFRKVGRGSYFLCHYERPEVFVAALYLRLMRSRVYAMFDSKFDDKPRRIEKELLKSLAFLPYHGALVGSRRTSDYLHFLGMRNRPMSGDYDTISIERIRRLAGVEPAPGGIGHDDRDFICVARLVSKKNHVTLLRAYARYRTTAMRPRDIHLCGDGPERLKLQQLANDLGLSTHVHFHGFVQAPEVSQMLGRSLALLLPSTEEQFGQVVLEAQAMGLPVIVSDNCGARDTHVRSGVNGFVVEATNSEGMAQFMSTLSDDKVLWTRMAKAAEANASAGDVARFVSSVKTLIGQRTNA